MTVNESSTDRVVRLVVAVAAFVLAFMVGAGSVGGIILFVVAAIALVTGATGFCPLYKLMGFSTNKTTISR